MIFNSTQRAVIADQHSICRSWLSKLLGYLFAPNRGALVFVNKKTLHTVLDGWFCRFPLTVLWLDAGRRVVAKDLLRPWHMKSGNAKYIVEIPGRISCRIGDEIRFENPNL